MMQRAIGDLLTSWRLLAIAAGIAVLLSFAYSLFLKYCAKCLVWTALMAIGLCLGLLAGYCFKTAGDYKNQQNEDRANVMWVFAGIFALMFVIFVLVVFFMRERIK